MSKIVRSINIDENIWNEAKSKFPNMSQFIEDFLKISLLNKNNDEIILRQTQIQLQQEMITLQTKLNTIESELNNITHEETSQSIKEQQIWEQLILEQNQHGMIKTSTLEEAENILGYRKKILEKKVIILIERKDEGIETRENLRNWEYVKENYLN